MSKNIFLVLLAICATILVPACGESPSENIENAPLEINPNGVSELAALMRNMQAHTRIMRSETKLGKFRSKTIPSSYDALKTAKPTKSDQKDETYDSFADAFTNAMLQYYQPEVPQYLRYQRVLETCIACHQRLCPGPIKAIKKLELDHIQTNIL